MEERRKLAAILCADVQGYSRLMGENEAETVRVLDGHLQAFRQGIEAHKGRVVDCVGDGLLAEFGSVVTAVRCAVEIQKTIASRNEPLAEERRMRFRIGINLGDVIERDGRLYGDGVNIAARIETRCEGGGICISGSAYDQVRDKVPFGFESLGELSAKNIARPLRVYRVHPDPAVRGRQSDIPVPFEPSVTGGAEPRSGGSRPDEPSIAVLPFENLSGDPGQEHVASGFTDDIITSLSMLPRIFVASRSATSVYRDRPDPVREIHRDLGVRYVLEGSIQRSGDRLRINAQLLEGSTGRHVWAERYDRDRGDLFGTRDELILNIASSIAEEITDGDVARIMRRNTNSLEAWEAYQHGRFHYERYNLEDNLRAREHYRRAGELDPNYVNAWLSLGFTHYIEGRFLEGEARGPAFDAAVGLAEKVLAMDPSYNGGHMLLCAVKSRRGLHGEAVAHGRTAVGMEPNNSFAVSTLALALVYAGEPGEAIGLFEKAMRLSPSYRPWYLMGLGHACLLTGRFLPAVEALKKAILRDPAMLPAHVWLTAAYAALGLDDEMHAAAGEVFRRFPGISVQRWEEDNLHRDPEAQELQRKLLRKAGFPESARG